MRKSATHGSLRFTRMDGRDPGLLLVRTCTITTPNGPFTRSLSEQIKPSDGDFLRGDTLAVALEDRARLDVPRPPNTPGDWTMTLELEYGGGEGVARAGNADAAEMLNESAPRSVYRSTVATTTEGQAALRRTGSGVRRH